MDRVCKPKDLDGSSSSDARVSASEDADEDVFQWPTKTSSTSSTITITVPQNGVRSATDAAAAALPLPPGVWTAVFDYEASADDELSLRRGDVVEVLSKDSLVSGDEGWWTGMIADRVGIFPSNYVSTGKVIAEEIRDSAEHLPVPPPLHREYLHCVFLMQLFKKKTQHTPLFCLEARGAWSRDTCCVMAGDVGLFTVPQHQLLSIRTIVYHITPSRPAHTLTCDMCHVNHRLHFHMCACAAGRV